MLRFLLLLAICAVGACHQDRPNPFQGKIVLRLESVDVSKLPARTSRGNLETAAKLAEDRFSGAMALCTNASNVVYFLNKVSGKHEKKAFNDRMIHDGASMVGFVQLVFGNISVRSGAGSTRVGQELYYRVSDYKGKILCSDVARAESTSSYRNSSKGKDELVGQALEQGVGKIVDLAARNILNFFGQKAGE